MSNHDSAPLEERFFLFEQQDVTVHDFESLGHILDIGGGGEGIIGILKGEKVIAIDARKEELEEAADGPLKITMDARNLQFLDSTFNTVTAFFTLMYLKSKPDYEEVFSEVFRVLKPGGRFLIWDVSVPQRPKGEGRNYLVLVRVTVKGRVIDTGYGQPWPEEEHDLTFFVDLAEKRGFQVMEQIEDGKTFFLQLQKP
jgi:ubiquinone/menaquinone biosynthesis C-methylase UbiE